jgi:hypothetical protein
MRAGSENRRNGQAYETIRASFRLIMLEAIIGALTLRLIACA